MRNRRTFRLTPFHTLFIAAVILRVLLIANPGFEADISFWKSWGLATFDKWIIEGLAVSNNNCPTPVAYVLGGMVVIYSIFADPHNFNVFWQNTNLLFLAVAKFLPIIADIGIAGLLLFAGSRARRLHLPELPHKILGLTYWQLGALAVLWNPIVIIDGAWWGQVDSVGLVIFLAAVILALMRKSYLAGLVFILSMMTKLQNMIYGPVLFLLIWQVSGYRGLIAAMAGSITGFFGLNIEFFLTRNMDRVVTSLTQNYDYFPWMSLKAYNLWWIVTGGQGMAVSDKVTVLGITNAKTVGLLIFSGLYGTAVLSQILAPVFPRLKTRETRHQRILPAFFSGLIVINAAFFLFQTESHDRYAFPIAVFLILWGAFLFTNTTKPVFLRRFRIAVAAYITFSLLYFYNLHTALVNNYPANGLPVLSSLTGIPVTITVAYALITLFAVFLMIRIRQSQAFLVAVAVGTLFTVSALAAKNLPLLTRSSVPLTAITPYTSEQEYGRRQTDRTVQSSFGGPEGWERLSVQYAFYKHGIGSHANSRYVFDINRKFTRFTTDYGVDTEAGTRASVVFEIYGDDRLLFRSEKRGRFDLPGHADVPVSGVKTLTLIITDAGDGNYDDHADWINPVLWP